MIKTGIKPAEILLPNTDDMTSWSCVACDQFTSEKEYWESLEKEVDGKTLGLIHKLKTVALIKAAVLMGCFASGADEKLCELAENYAENFGFAFQIIDDILDFDGNYETCELNSYVKVHGLEKARKDAMVYIDSANKNLLELSENGFETSNFNELLDFLIKRMK